jgi:hypothetical protein
MNAPLDSNSGQNASALPCPEKLADCANEPQKLLIPKELHLQNNPKIPSKTPKIPLKTPQKAQKSDYRTPEIQFRQRLTLAKLNKPRDAPLHLHGPNPPNQTPLP